jgi:pimeloyl-ACP methyl ester carboxylesterase
MRRLSCDRAPLLATLVLMAAGCTRFAETNTTQPAVFRLTEALDQFFEIDGFQIRYREIGRGIPVVLLHGRGSNLDVWNWLADSLATGHRVIAFDQRGAGFSSKSGDSSRYGRAMANDVVGLLDHLGLRRAHLIAHSQGAVIAAYVAAHHPDRVITASLIAGPHPADSASYAAASAATVRDLENGIGMINFYRNRAPNDSIARALNAEAMARNDAPSLAATIRALGGLALSTDNPPIRVPALVIVGTRDALLETNRRFASRIRSELVEIPEGTHPSVLRDAQVLNRLRLHIRSGSSRN